MFAKLVFIAAAFSLTTVQAVATPIGFDDRIDDVVRECRDLPVSVGRLFVPTVPDGPNMSTATPFTIDGGLTVFFITSAHSLFKGGEIRAPMDALIVDVLVENEAGVCRFAEGKVADFVVGSAKPRATFFGAARDMAILKVVFPEGVVERLAPLQIRATPICANDKVNITAFAWDVANGMSPYRSSCRLRAPSPESEYDGISFQHHDCDTSAGSSGGLLTCRDGSGEEVVAAMHVVGWGTPGAPYGEGAYNVALPIDYGRLLNMVLPLLD